MRDAHEQYFTQLDARLEEAFDVARTARSHGKDPVPSVEIPLAEDMADRVENILGIPGVAERVRELEAEMDREEAALALAEDFAEGRVGEFDTPADKIEGAVRTAVALLTEGVVAAPIEGIDRVELCDNDDGTEFVRVFYAGPIRSAGGTAQALSVLVADYTRTLLGIDRYKPRPAEIERFAEEISLYDNETGLQYTPVEAEAKFIAEHCPIMLDGEPTGDEEVSGYRNLDRITTNNARGGMCLVLAEGIALKAPKIERYTSQLDDVNWPWLDDLLAGSFKQPAPESTSPADEVDEDTESSQATVSEPAAATGAPPGVTPSNKYLRDLIAGRPVFGHPSEPGGFRLRYGRARNHGFATAGVHPATMRLVDDFLATGTQLKTERPGKAAGVVPVDSIEGPTVKLATGEVRQINDPETALELRNGVDEILDLGEYLVNYGEFVENNHALMPAPYVAEWWRQDFEAAGGDVQALADDPHTDLANPPARQALDWAETYEAPLHPTYTYLWHDITVAELEAVTAAVEQAELVEPDGAVIERADDVTIALPATDTVARALESLLIEHTQGEETITIPDALPFLRTLGFTATLEKTWSELPTEAADAPNALPAVNAVAPFTVRERAPTRIGSRMGRPEKSEHRELNPAVHTLFPIGNAGGDQRDVTAAATNANDTNRRGSIEVSVARRRCPECATLTFHPACPECDHHTELEYRCPDCDIEIQPDEATRVECPRCETPVTAVDHRSLDLNAAYHQALDAVGERENAFEMLKGVKGLTSADKTPEPIEKGILRAKHDISAFKDGTVRYDMTDLPVTSVRPAELDSTADTFRELGYEQDLNGDPLEYDDQLVPLRVQDIVLSDGAAEHLVSVANFVDDLLENYYGLDAFYDVTDRRDLVGELVFGLAPHTSAAVVGRIVGFTSAAVGYAHPYFHAAKRRNCFHPSTKLWYEDEAGEWHYDRVEALVEERLDPETADEDDFGTLVSELDDGLIVPSLTRDGTPTRNPVTAVSKHPAPDHLVQIETTAGNTIRVTPDHSMLRWAGGLTEVHASELTVGDRLPAYDGGETTMMTGESQAVADGDTPLALEEVIDTQYIESDVDHTYCLTVAESHTLAANGLYTKQCDGDEDCVMLLMDGLLNFSKQYLPDKRGGSVAEDSRLVAVDPDGVVQFTTFDEFWKELESPIKHDGKFQKKTCLVEGWKTFAFDDRHEASLRPIEKAIRYPAAEDETLLRVETQFGRSLEITDHHSLFRYENGIQEVAGEELAEGDLIVAPRRLGIDPETTTIDVTECLDEPYVVIDDDVETFLTSAWESGDRGGEVRRTFRNGLAYRLQRQKISFERFRRLLDRSTTTEIPSDIRIGRSGSTDGIRREITVDEEFGWLLGLFVAEGTLLSTCPAIHNADEELIEKAVAAAEGTLGHDPQVRWSNRAYEIRFPSVFREVLYELGFEDRETYDSSEKTVPECIRRAPRDVVLSFLRGFIAGDGSDKSDDNVTTVGFHTVSEDVKDGLVFLLHRIGIVSNVSYRDDRDGNRQSIYTVTVSGGANDNPLHRVLDGQEPYLSKSLVVRIPDALMEIREMDIDGVKQLIPKYLLRRENVSLEKLREMIVELDNRDLPNGAQDRLEELWPLVDGDLSYLRVKNIERIDYDGYLYDLQVGGEPIFTANWLYAHNSMDAPLVMSSRIDPTEIDDEAHNIDITAQYSREFYEATREMADPGEVDIPIAADQLETDQAYGGFAHTHDTSNIALGPALSAYKTLGSMDDKLDAQLELARSIRAVDEVDVAERIIEYHFLPDLIGNLRAFSRQETRCLDCGHKYRRPPLMGECRECGGTVNLTVHEGSVNKYMQTALRIADDFGSREYTKQRLRILERSLESIFEDDTNRPSTLGDYM